MCLHGSVHCEGMQRIHRGIVHGADDPGGTDDIPRCVVRLAVFPQDVFPAYLPISTSTVLQPDVRTAGNRNSAPE